MSEKAGFEIALAAVRIDESAVGKPCHGVMVRSRRLKSSASVTSGPNSTLNPR